MNIFRATADLLHVLSILIILFKVRKSKNSQGLSSKTQELYLVVFCTRYLDLFWNFHSMYNWVMKIIFISTTAYVVYLIRFRFKASYDSEHDTFKILYLIVPCFVFALGVNHQFTVVEVLWAFSIYLEALAGLPQLFLLQRTGNVENLTVDYIFCLGAYRALYVLNWIYRYFTEPNYVNWLVWIPGLIQTIIYCDFFYYYVISKYYGKKMTLPS